MGTHSHKPAHDKPEMKHEHDGAKTADGPGVRPGTKSRILEARERLAKKD